MWCGILPVSRICEYNKLFFLGPLLCLLLWPHLTDHHVKEHRTVILGVLEKDEVAKENYYEKFLHQATVYGKFKLSFPAYLQISNLILQRVNVQWGKRGCPQSNCLE